MTDLESRLRSIRVDVHAGAPVAELHRRVASRRRHRRAVAGAVVVLMVAGSAAVVGWPDPGHEDLVAGPGEDGDQVDADPSRVLGGVEGVRVEVEPAEHLDDGALVEVRIDGLGELPGAVLLQCAGDVSEHDATRSCDLAAVAPAGAGEPVPQVRAEPTQVVSVSRTIYLTREDPNSQPYDCALEPPGCVLAVAPWELPARAVLVPLSFTPTPAPEAAAEIQPPGGLQDLQEVRFRASGLRPNGTFTIRQCREDAPRSCDALNYPSAAADPDGVLDTTVKVTAALYGHEGRTDCTTQPCVLQIQDQHGTPLAEAPVRFADDVAAPIPELRLDPPGPYTDRQLITVQGSGFPPGMPLGSIAQCPADRDTAQEERCGYSRAFDSDPDHVGPDGTFTITQELFDSLMFTGPCAVTGCLIAWVILHGPIAASAPIEFRD